MIFNTEDSLFKSGKKYTLIVADPPWKYTRDSKGLSGCVSNRKGGEGYITMSDEEIAYLPVHKIRERNSVLCLWATGARMDSAIRVMSDWGFTFKTVLFVWQKVSKSGSPRMVMGNYTRPSTEFILLGTRGNGIKIPTSDKIHNMHQVVSHPIIGHSVKPLVFIDKIEALFHNPTEKLEMFARVGREGWDLFGNEAAYDPHYKPPAIQAVFTPTTAWIDCSGCEFKDHGSVCLNCKYGNLTGE
jgi:N6-adenosine-specific RNA methylase IME4